MLNMVEECLSEDGRTKLLSPLEAGDPKGEAQPPGTPRRPSESFAAIKTNRSPSVGSTSSAQTSPSASDRQRSAHSYARSSVGVLRSPPNTPVTSRTGPTEAMNNLIKRVKRVAFGFTSFRTYRIRALLYAGKPDWSLLAKHSAFESASG